MENLSANLNGPGVIHLVGPNGSGKSTAVEVVAGYLRPWSGRVLVNGMLPHRVEARSGRAVVRSLPALYSKMTVSDHLVFSARARHSRNGHDELMARADQYGLLPWMDYAADQLSTGNKRKLWILMCTGGKPRTVVLDEPFDGLDADGIEALVNEINLWRETRMVVVVAHRVAVKLRCDLSFSLPAGQVVPWVAAAENVEPSSRWSDADSGGERQGLSRVSD